ncbi:KAT8 regulatory NSL complex subunit [Trema orientale]|uniref:KAT8 regulatory NSL complex subunit 2 n=1 Tax=Trema orientale TaxID=63057 RepID=A0A2P5FZZ5_TREOI|nr:KAT8 regulatory NSL complex subunit [Trema orientale]
MAAASSSRPPKTPITLTNNLNPKNFQEEAEEEERDILLSRASHLTRQEVLRRRSQRLRQLAKCYRDHYWALMEDLRVQHRLYYWRFGVSPFKRDAGDERESSALEDDNNGGNGGLKNNRQCAFMGCKLKPMALTTFCHLHILSDSKQKLYKPCNYVIKSAQAGPITCGKPILRSTAPSLCSVHFQKAQKHVTRALKKAGLNVSSSSKLAPKFHVIVAEYVRQIQAKRRALQKANRNKAVVKEESAS